MNFQNMFFFSFFISIKTCLMISEKTRKKIARIPFFILFIEKHILIYANISIIKPIANI